MSKRIGKILICIYCILLASVFLNTAFSRNSSKITGSAEVNVAGLKLNIIKNTSSITNLGTTEQNIQFTINNFEGTKTTPTYNDVEYTYKITITNNKNIPVQYDLYKITSGTQTQIPLTNGTTQNFTMPKSTLQEDQYILKVKMNDKSYKNTSGALTINVNGVQS